MKITKLSIENFKKFKDRTEFEFLDQNFFVGENNTGKTSVIEAINYLLSGSKKGKEYKNISSAPEEYIAVEATISGNFSGIDKKYQDYIIDSGDTHYIKLRRSDEEKEIEQSSKKTKVKLNESKILCWSEERQQFENPSGKDTTFNVVDVVSVYANDHVDNVVSFDSTKILGKLIKSRVGDFFETPEYLKFKKHHDDIFNTGENSLKTQLSSLSNEISDILKEQWGEVELNFEFDVVDDASHLKKGSVLVKEGSVEHGLEDKGSGLQRSIMLSMIQVLSKINIKTESNIILCIDEPELNLHPKAQEKLAEALSRLSNNIQVIISTHSPYVLKSFKKHSDTVYVFANSQFVRSEKLEKLSVLPFGPTLSEIQYFAYNLTPNDLHNELYGYLESEGKIGSFSTSKKWLDSRKLLERAEDLAVSVEDVGERDRELLKRDVSIQTYIRHSIHHPENEYNKLYTEEEIEKSISEMIDEI